MPPTASPVAASRTSAGVVHTVTALHQLHITHVWLSAQNLTTSPAAGRLEMKADVAPAATSLVILSVEMSDVAGSGGNPTLSAVDIKVDAGDTVDLVLTTAAGSSIAGGIIGYEEKKTGADA
jgi:hypothetical protein